MSKTIIGLGVVAVAAVGGYVGTEAYIKHRISNEIEANFAQIRANGGRAEHGALAFSLWTRDVTISDIAVEFAAPRPAKIKVASFAARHLGQDGNDAFTADAISMSGIEASGTAALPDGGTITLTMPELTIAQFRGPTRLQSQPASSSPLDIYRFGLEQSAAIRAGSITAPSLVARIEGNKIASGTGYTYSDIDIRDVKNGKIATASIGRMNFTAAFLYGKTEQVTGDIAGIKTEDIDMVAMAALLDPAKTNDDKTYRLIGQTTAGTYTLKSDKNYTIRIDSFSGGEMKAQPSRLKLPAFAALLLKAGAQSDLTQNRAVIEAMPSLYEGLSIADTSLKGLSVEMPDGSVKLAALRFGIDGGKIGEFAIEGLDGVSPKGPVKLGRFALKGFDVAALLRMSAKFNASGRTPSTDEMMGMLTLLEGIEFKDLSVPHKDSGKQITLHDARLNWGQFVGPIPSRIHLKLNMTGPLEEKDGEPFTLLRDVGIDEATANIDVGVTWHESEKKLTLAPGTFDISKLFALNAELSLDNVQRDLFTTNPTQAIVTTSLIKPGVLKMTLRDLGGIDLALAQRARNTGITAEAVRNELVDQIRSTSAQMAVTQPNADQIGTAIAAFISKPNGTLTLTVTPKQSMRLLELIEVLKASGPDAVSLFQIDAQTAP